MSSQVCSKVKQYKLKMEIPENQAHGVVHAHVNYQKRTQNKTKQNSQCAVGGYSSTSTNYNTLRRIEYNDTNNSNKHNNGNEKS